MPAWQSWLSFSRLRGRVKHRSKLGVFGLYLQARGGSILGDLPPYEAFPIGGTNSVRGYGEGAVGTARHFLTGTAEVLYPTGVKGVQGTIFGDIGSDLNSGMTVVGDPAGVRNKPGKGWGYGGGVLLDTPLGPLRFEYA